MLYAFFSGGISMLCLVACFFFFNFYQKVKDKFFLLFSFAFLCFAIERMVIMANRIHDEDYTMVYLIRVVGFLIILIAIYFKNSGSKTLKQSNIDKI
ncbi:MAG: DUF5985 family protein [Bdellovibrionota bacterium]